MKLPIWHNGWLRDWKKSFLLSSTKSSNFQRKLFPQTYYIFSSDGLIEMWQGSDEESTYFAYDEDNIVEVDINSNGADQLFERLKPTRYIRPTYHARKVHLMSLEGNIETDEVSDVLGWIGFTKVVLPKPPPSCNNCNHGDTGNHGDEPVFCNLLEQSVGDKHGLILCPLYSPSRRATWED